jgi:lysophospholipase L1-like esterase
MVGSPADRDRVSRTVLIFGDSNTRGFGVGRERRFSSLIEKALAPTVGSAWRFVVKGTESDFRLIPERLEKAVTTTLPDIIVWQLPTGPCSYFVRYPWWLRPFRAVYDAVFEQLRERGIRGDAALRGGSEKSARDDALYEGLFLDDLHRWRPATWPVTRHGNKWLASHYGTEVKATRERYLELVGRHSDRLRALSDAHQLLLGFLPHSDDMFPGYGERAVQWSKDLQGLLHQPARGRTYFELYGPLTQGGVARNLLRDGIHLSAEGHRRVAELVSPVLLSLISDRSRG